MEIGLFTWNQKNNIVFIILIILLGACTQPPKIKPDLVIPHAEELKTGNLVCRLGNGYFSQYFKEYASKERKYSHIGVLSIENDTVFVYHSEASELTGIGCVKREALSSFLYEIKTYDFFNINLSDTIVEKVVANSRSYYDLHTSFDLDFDSFNDDELYCSELVALSINKATCSNLIKPSLELNQKKLYALDDIYCNEMIKRITFE
jgi:hypothetical protein